MAIALGNAAMGHVHRLGVHPTSVQGRATRIRSLQAASTPDPIFKHAAPDWIVSTYWLLHACEHAPRKCAHPCMAYSNARTPSLQHQHASAPAPHPAPIRDSVWGHRTENLQLHRAGHHRATICTASSRNYIEPKYDIKLYDYIKLWARLSSSSTSPTQSMPRSTFTWSSAAADKTPAVAVIFDRRRRLRQDPPLPWSLIVDAAYDKTRRRLKTRRYRRIPAAAA
jgi:hypothetical protein